MLAFPQDFAQKKMSVSGIVHLVPVCLAFAVLNAEPAFAV
jgi:hypothetical protein